MPRATLPKRRTELFSDNEVAVVLQALCAHETYRSHGLSDCLRHARNVLLIAFEKEQDRREAPRQPAEASEGQP